MFKVCIVGRPNVGKSTLFNRLIGKKVAFIDKEPGITRDRNYGEAIWGKFSFTLIDTGGIDNEKTDIAGKIKEQVDFAIKEADLIILLLDGKDGILPGDIEILNSLRKRGKDVLLVVNKMDKTPYKESDLADFYKLGLPLIPISSDHGINIDELLDEIRDRGQRAEHQSTRAPEHQRTEVEGINIAIIGRPNVGKSSLLNLITKKQRVIVSSTPGTTRDSIIEGFTFKDREFTLVDTVGIRKKIASRIEAGYVASAKRCIKKADIVWLLIDGFEGLTSQEKRLIEEIESQFVPYIIVVNKLDLIKADKSDYRAYILKSLPFLDSPNILFTSCITGIGIKTLLNETYSLSESLNISIKTSLLNKAISQFKIERPKIYYATQTNPSPPTFTLFVNNPLFTEENFLKRIKRFLRKKLNISIPINVLIKKA
ncbi:MAG: ribosome biogenesis GTPase Der [bacterium]